MYGCHEDLNWHYERTNKFRAVIRYFQLSSASGRRDPLFVIKKVFSATSPTTRNEIKAKRSGINQVSYYKRGDFVRESNKCRSAASYRKVSMFLPSSCSVAAPFCETFNESRFLRSTISLEKYFCWFSIHSVCDDQMLGKIKEVAFLLRILNDLCNIVRMLSAFIFLLQQTSPVTRTFEAEMLFFRIPGHLAISHDKFLVNCISFKCRRKKLKRAQNGLTLTSIELCARRMRLASRLAMRSCHVLAVLPNEFRRIAFPCTFHAITTLYD